MIANIAKCLALSTFEELKKYEFKSCDKWDAINLEMAYSKGSEDSILNFDL